MRIVGSGDKEIWWVRGYNGRVGQDGMGIGQLGRALGSRREGRGPSLRVLSLPFHSCPSIPLRPGSLSFPILLLTLWLPLFLHHNASYIFTPRFASQSKGWIGILDAEHISKVFRNNYGFQSQL